ncbi:hypothetical protein KW791_03785, partial [Candidatus Parcubacteria bacterium]|nr:hypothetical protein [Candidatus Parcubacteria bacterium]
SSRNPQFVWQMPIDATGVSYLVTDSPASNPGPHSDGITGKILISNVADGTHFFHLKIRRGTTWGPIMHYQFNIDSVLPKEFNIDVINDGSIKPEITFKTTDEGSGIDHYEVQIGNGGWDKIAAGDAGKSLPVAFNQIGSKIVTVKAIDQAGNEQIATTKVSVSLAAISSLAAKWISMIFDRLVDALSGNGLLLVLLLAVLGCAILIIKLFASGFRRVFKRSAKRRTLKVAERKSGKLYDHIVEDMVEEINFLESISKRRTLGPEEKYLKSKLQQYVKSLHHYDHK